MKKFNLLAVAFSAASGIACAGGYLTNTNQNAAFLRNPARLATFELDGAYSNPAGLAWIGEGWHLGFTWQNAAQTRTITSTFAPFAFNANQPGNPTRTFEGEASAPFIPSLEAAYQKGPWTATFHFGITGGGGKATFNSGLPMFEAPVSCLPDMLTQAGRPSDAYTSDMYMSGRQYIYGVQAGLTYKVFENRGDLRQGLSVHLGARMNFASNHYEGYMRNISATVNGHMEKLSPYFQEQSEAYAQKAAQAEAAALQFAGLAATATDPAQKAQYEAMQAQYEAGARQATAAAQTFGAYSKQTGDIELDCDQKGWGIAPIIGVDYRIAGLNIGARYEFRTNMNIENKTKVNTTGVASFANGVNTPNDIPAILAVGAQYDITKRWRVMGGWNCYFDKNAGMSGNKQKTLKRNTHELTAGMEYDVLDRLTVSGGYQRTDYGLSDAFQSDLSFSCDSYSLGFGVKVGITEKCDVNAAYFWTTYSDYTKVSDNFNGTGLPGTDVYSRTNKVFGISVNYHF